MIVRTGHVGGARSRIPRAHVSRHDIASIWVAFFQECQQYRCGQGWSSMYELSTSHAQGMSAMAVAANPSSGELIGVFAIDCKCSGALLPALSPS